MKKRILSFVVIMTMLIGCVPIIASAEIVDSGTCGENLTWTLDDSGTLTISGTGDMTDYKKADYYSPFRYRSIKSVIIENGVTSIGSGTLEGCSSLTSITIPDSVTNIGGGAFSRCSGLTSVIMPNSVTSIGDYTFSGCSGLTSITIPNSVTSIGECAFDGCSSLTSVTIPDSVTSISDYAFRNCSNLTSITIPDSVTRIGGDAFYKTAYYNNTDNWEDGVLYIGNHLIDVNNSNTKYQVKIGTTTIAGNTLNGLTDIYYDSEFEDFTKIIISGDVQTNAKLHCSDMTINKLGQCGWETTYYFDETTGTLTIGGKGDMQNYSTDYRAPWFEPRRSIKSVIIRNGITNIGSDAFDRCYNLTSVTIPNSVTSIGGGAFYECGNLTSVTIPDSVTNIGSNAFYQTAYYNNTDNWENGALYIGKHFIKANRDEINAEYRIKTGTKTIAPGAFDRCRELTSVTIPDSVTSIGASAFRSCSSLTSVTIPNSVTSIGECAFEYCSSLETIYYNATNCTVHFSIQDCAALKVYIGDHVETIPASAFRDCSSLTDVTMGNSVTNIGCGAFSGCSSLTSVTIPNSVTSIGECAFDGCSSLTSITIPDSITSIGNGAFGDCSSLTSIAIPDSVTSIGYNAFGGCSSLTSVTIPDSVTSISDYAFSRCSGLTSIIIPESVTSIGDEVFSGCSSLTSINVDSKNSNYCSDNGNLFNKEKTELIQYAIGKTDATYAIPNSVRSIGDRAFSDCSSLTSITIPNSITNSDYAFEDCKGLTSVIIQNNVKIISCAIFAGCSGLTSVFIPNSVTTVEYRAFEDCYSLKDVYYGGTEEKWKKISIDYYNECLTNATIHYNSTGGAVTPSPSPSPDIPIPAVERTVTAKFGGGTLIYDEEYDHYSADSFILSGEIENLYIKGDSERKDTSAYNVKAELTLPEGYSFSASEDIRSKTVDVGVIYYADGLFTETVYVKNPPVGKSTMTAKITGDNVKEKTVTYDFTVDKYEFNADVYRANFLINSDIGSKMENTYFDLSGSPSQLLMKSAKENNLDIAADSWAKFMNTMNIADSPSKILDYAIEETDMYEAIIMSMLESSVDYEVVEYINNDTIKKSKALFDLITSEMKDVYQMTNFKWDKMSSKERGLLADNISGFFKNDNPKIAAASKVSSVAGNVLKYAGDAQSAIETIVSYYNMWCLSNAMKQVLDDMYHESISYNNSALSQALLNCTSIINSGAVEFTASMMGRATLTVGKDLAQFAFDKLWGNIKTSFQVAYPGAFLLHATYSASKYITGVCFNADAIEEKYCKIEALVNAENVLMSVYNDEKRKFKGTDNVYAAKVYNSAVDAMFQMLDTDCDYAIAFADAVDSSLAGTISSALGDSTVEDFKKSVKSIQTSTDLFHETVLTYWIGELQKEGNYRYKDYLYLMDESYERMKKRYNISCPVDVYVFDTNGVIVGSVVDNVPYCRNDADITISVEGDKKILYMYGNNEYNIVYEGNDMGTMDIAVTEYDDENNASRDVYFNGLELTDGLKYTSTESGTISEDNAYILVSEESENIAPDYDSQTDSNGSTYTVSIERGYFIDDTAVSRDLHSGENVQIAAYVPDGYKFVGWTSDAEDDIFEDASSITTRIRMPAQNVNIRANIAEKPRLNITEKTDTSVNIQALACDDITGGTIILAVYDENSGVLKNVFTKDYEKTVVFDNLDLTGCIVKAMLWDSLKGMKPLCEAGEN